MNDEGSTNRFFPSVSASSFSFFEAGQQAEIQPSYLLYPQVRNSDLRISLTIIRTGENPRGAREANIRQAQRSPFGLRQRSYAHYSQRFRQTKTALKDVIQEGIKEDKAASIKTIVRQISALMSKRIQPLTLEECEQLRQLQGQLNPRLRAEDEKVRAGFNAAWAAITANGLNGELTTSSKD